MSRWRRLGILLALAVVVSAPAAQPRAAADPILILVSFDGWRWDYINTQPVPNLRALAARGVHATELIPSFPSFTFPNHYTIVTGLYPEHHGIVANTIADPGFPERFTMSADTARDGRWWKGEPIWATAIREGKLAGAMFWPGDEAPIDGMRPTYWRPFMSTLSSADRVTQVLDWLALPDDRRPSFAGLYLEEVDHAGHDFGPDSPELRTAAGHLDAALGQLLEGVTQLGLADRTTIVVVSDHGMAAASEDRLIYLDDYLDLEHVDVIEAGELVQLAPRAGTTAEAIYRGLRGKNPHLTIYTPDRTPARFHYRDNPRIAPVIGLVDNGWIATSWEAEAARKWDAKPRRGAHGYDPRLRDMHGLFVAAGPDLRRGLVARPFANIHIYDLLCRVLNLTPAPNDGEAAVTRRFFR